MEDRGTGISEAAGNLLAELYVVTEEYRHGRVSVEALRQRVAVIRRRQQAFNQHYLQVTTWIKFEGKAGERC